MEPSVEELQDETPPLRARIARAIRGFVRPRADAIRERLQEEDQRPGSLAALGAALLVLLGFFGYLALLISLPHVGSMRDAQAVEASIAYAADGQELSRYHIENRTWVPLDSIAKPVVNALLATEDRRFYHHIGIDIPRLFGAIVGTAAGDPQGGSTLTMQLARNIYPEIADDWTPIRKVKEWVMALKLEGNFTKNEILEMYLNSVPFMYDAVGIEAAARTYFQKPARALTLPESATLIGMLKATVYYNPVRNPRRSHERRNVVLGQMVRYGYLDRATYERLAPVPTALHFRRLTRDDNRAPYFAEYVRQFVEAWAERHGRNLYTDGLRIHTTLDPRLQSAAEQAVQEVTEGLQRVVDVEWATEQPYSASTIEAYQGVHGRVRPFAWFWQQHPAFLNALLRQTPRYRTLVAAGAPPDSALRAVRASAALVDSVTAPNTRLDAGFVAIEPSTGAVRAWVGGRAFRHDEYDHVWLARRQPGSTFKPFVYATALMNGFSPYSVLADRVVSYRDPNTGDTWSPRNFGGATGRAMSLRQALAFSKNTITAQLMLRVGPQKVVDVAHRMGIASKLQAVPSLGLGTSDVSLLELTSAYATFARDGQSQSPLIVTRIEDRYGRLLVRFQPPRREAIPPYVARTMIDMMRGVVRFGTAARLGPMFGAKGDLAGKTGTTQNAADGWFMLMHPNLVMGAWVGFNDPRVTFRTDYWGQGAHNALHVVGTFYERARKLEPDVLDPEAKFDTKVTHSWSSGRGSTADQLTRREREQNNLGEILERLRARHGTQPAPDAPPQQQEAPPAEAPADTP